MKVFFKRLGEFLMALGGLALSVMFWLFIATVVLVSTIYIRAVRLIKPGPMVVGEDE